MIAVTCCRHPTLTYAGRELCKYLNRMAGIPSAGLFTGEMAQELPQIRLAVTPEEFQLPDPAVDDAVSIQLKSGEGFIHGSNPRAVLIGVYRALRALGCRFIRPGPDGEVVPKLPVSEFTVSLREAASFRHRGGVIEGANSLENVLDYIEWLPKAGYNSFFTQFMDLSCFFGRWYNHEENPCLAPEAYGGAFALQCEERVWQEIARRSLLHHTMGHGWTCESIGIESRDWNAVRLDISPENRELLAMVGGERGLFDGVPTTTNLCYSNPRARKAICRYALSYLKAHSGVRYLHLWLADSIHSFCECESCREKTPSDWYLLLLNELDECLAAENIDTRVVFLLYLDLLFPPKSEMLHNPERFVLMFAPISRPFGQSLADFAPSEKPAPYLLNQTPIPRTVEENLACLRGWQEYLEKAGLHFDSFDFDYYLGRAHYGDPGYCAISRIIDKDIEHLSRLGLNGILSCQELRAFYPTGLPCYLMGLKLWDAGLSYEQIADEYFTAAYGRGGGEVRALLEKISRCFDIDYWFNGRAAANSACAAKMEQALPLARQADALSAALQPENDCEKTSRSHLASFGEYLTLYTRALLGCAGGQPEEGKRWWERFCRFIRENETALQPALDAFRIQAVGRHFFFGNKQ